MVNAKKLPKGGDKVEDSQNFDEFLETLDDSDSDADSDSEDEVGAAGNSHIGQNGDAGTGSSEGDEEDSDQDDENDTDEDEGSEEEHLEEDEDEEELELEEELKKDEDEIGDNESEGGDEPADPEQTALDHKKSLQRLRETDPDFFEYLKENDAELLKFDDSGEDSDSEDEDEEGPVHQLPDELEEASDSEAEEERIELGSEEHKGKVDKFLKKGIVNLNVIADWETKLSSSRDLGVFVNVIEAFECAVQQVLQGGAQEDQKWKVEGSANFNALVRLCIKHVKSFCVRYLFGSNNLAVSENKFDQRPLDVKDKCGPRWTKLRSKIKAYMVTLVEFLKSMGNTDAIASILRHCQKMSGFWALMGSKSFKLLRTLIHIWSQGEDSCRVLAFLTIIRMSNYNRDVFLQRIFKQMYMSYVSNCKFTSVNTWAAINFMRSSMVEVYILDTSMAYSIAFPFIRQLAIHLRNAVTAGTSGATQQTKHNKKEASRIVYSWQFVHSLNLWADLLAQAGSTGDEHLKLLIYPVVQICLGAIKLIPTKKYIPLRFLMIRMLIKLQDKAGVFIPILPLITEVLFMTDFSSKSVSKFSVRPLDMTCCLKADATESGYSKAVSETVFELVLACSKSIATELSFPEIVTPTLMQLRSFLKKKCKNPEVVKKFKTLIEKIEANSKYISIKRNKALETGTVSLSDVKSQQILKVQMETSKPYPPVLEFATEYFKVHARAQAKLRKVNTETRDEKLIPKPTALNPSNKKKEAKRDGPIFGSDGESDSDSEFKTKLDSQEVEEKPKKKLKRKNQDKGTAVSNKKKKNKGNIQIKNNADDAQDELVDFELSD